jgi:hypothetical protein
MDSRLLERIGFNYMGQIESALPVHYVLPDRLISCLTRDQANPWVRKITLSQR